MSNINASNIDEHIAGVMYKLGQLELKNSLGTNLLRFLNELQPLNDGVKILISREMFPDVKEDVNKINERILETAKFLEKCLMYNRQEYSEIQGILGKLAEYKIGHLQPDQGTPHGPFGERARPGRFGKNKGKKKNK